MEYIVSELPSVLEPSSTYFVQLPEAGVFNMYVTDSTGRGIPLGTIERAYKVKNNLGQPSNEQIFKITIDLEEGITELPEKWLPNFRSINPINYTNIKLPNSLVNLKDYSLEGYPLTRFEFPNTWAQETRTYGKYLFKGSAISEVPRELEGKLTEGMFMDSKVRMIPANTTDFPKNVFKGAEITEIRDVAGSWNPGSVTLHQGAFHGKFPVTSIQSEISIASWEVGSIYADIDTFDLNRYYSLNTASQAISPFVSGSKVKRYITSTISNSYTDEQTKGAEIELLDLSGSHSINLENAQTKPALQNVKKVKFPTTMTEYPDFSSVANFNSGIIYDVEKSDLERITKIDTNNGRFDFTGSLELPSTFPGVSIGNYGKITELTVTNKSQVEKMFMYSSDTVINELPLENINVKTTGTTTSSADILLLQTTTYKLTTPNELTRKIKKLTGTVNLSKDTIPSQSFTEDLSSHPLDESINIDGLKFIVKDNSPAAGSVDRLIEFFQRDSNVGKLLDASETGGKIVFGAGGSFYNLPNPTITDKLLKEINESTTITRVEIFPQSSDSSDLHYQYSVISGLLEGVKYANLSLATTGEFGGRGVDSNQGGSLLSKAAEANYNAGKLKLHLPDYTITYNQLKNFTTLFHKGEVSSSTDLTITAGRMFAKESTDGSKNNLMPISSISIALPNYVGIENLSLKEDEDWSRLTRIEVTAGNSSDFTGLFNYINSAPASLNSITLQIDTTKQDHYGDNNAELKVKLPAWVTSDKIGEIGFVGASTKGKMELTLEYPGVLEFSKFKFKENQNDVIKVPADQVENYKVASGWSTMANKIQAI